MDASFECKMDLLRGTKTVRICGGSPKRVDARRFSTNGSFSALVATVSAKINVMPLRKFPPPPKAGPVSCIPPKYTDFGP